MIGDHIVQILIFSGTIAVILCFIQDWIKLLTKLKKIVWLRLLVLLTVASYAVLMLAPYIAGIIWWCVLHLYVFALNASRLLPFQKGALFLTQSMIVFMFLSFPWWVFVRLRKENIDQKIMFGCIFVSIVLLFILILVVSAFPA